MHVCTLASSLLQPLAHSLPSLLHLLPEGNAREDSLFDLVAAHSQELWLVSVSCLLSNNHFTDLNPFRIRLQVTVIPNQPE